MNRAVLSQSGETDFLAANWKGDPIRISARVLEDRPFALLEGDMLVDGVEEIDHDMAHRLADIWRSVALALDSMSPPERVAASN